MGYELSATADACYPGTLVLVNKLDIRDEKQLEDAETDIVSIKSVLWEESPLSDRFDFAHYQAVHAFLFGDLYEWAGQIRTIDFSKKGTRFCPAMQIDRQAQLIFARLKEQSFLRGMAHDDFVAALVDFYCSTNNLHPFREGNGRTQRVFLTQLVRAAGYQLHFADMDGELLMIATIQAAQGVTDLLCHLFHEAIHPL